MSQCHLLEVVLTEVIEGGEEGGEKEGEGGEKEEEEEVVLMICSFVGFCEWS